MKYYFFESRSVPGDPIAQDMNVPASFSDFDFGGKLKLPKKPLRLTVSKPKRRLPDVIQGPYTYIIVSEQLRELFLELEPKHVQFAPIEVFHGAEKLAVYYFVQVLDNVDAIDWVKSKLESYPEDKYAITRVTKLVLDKGRLRDRHAFRIQGLDSRLAVSETFGKRANDAGMTGMRFTNVDAFQKP
jgi:hypothetical protein